MEHELHLQSNTALRAYCCFLLAMSTGCHDERVAPPPSSPRWHDIKAEHPSLPSVEVTRLGEWIGFDVMQKGEPELLRAYDVKEVRCSGRWRRYSYGNVLDWPRRFASAHIEAFALDGKVEVLWLQFYEIYPPRFLMGESVLEDMKYSLGFGSEVKFRARKYYAGKYPSALQGLDVLIRGECDTLLHDGHEIGYQCADFAISSVHPFGLGGMDWGIYPSDSSDSQIGRRSDSPDIMIESLQKPSLPLYVKHELCEGCHGIAFFIYRDVSSFQRFASDVRSDFNTMDCVRGL